MTTNPARPTFPQLVRDFFCERLIVQKNASRHTVSSYRDTFRLLFSYAEAILKKSPTDLSVSDLDTSVVLSFLDHLECDRGNSPRSRNVRLAAIRSFLSYAVLRDPAAIDSASRVRAIPFKRHDRRLLGYLSRDEIQAIIDGPDQSRWSGQRDQALFSTLYNTGARVAEIVGLQMRDIDLQYRLAVHIHGKGRKERLVPLWKSTVTMLQNWKRRSGLNDEEPAFPNRFGRFMTRSGVEDRLKRAVAVAAQECPRLKKLRVSPHTIRHYTQFRIMPSGRLQAAISALLRTSNSA